MSRKSRQKAERKAERQRSKQQNAENIDPKASRKKLSSADEFDTPFWVVETPLVILAAITVGYVALKFEMNVNRVFDIPKALYLKTGGCVAFLLWIAWGSVFGFAWKSIKNFVAPVTAVVAAVGISTLFSIDPWMSWTGVYERQFGFQGIMACFGLFVVTATCLRTRERARTALMVITAFGAIMSAHAFLQSQGMDPWGFFKKPHNKVYATLGNATFAGNSLALIFPLSMMVATVAAAQTWFEAHLSEDSEEKTFRFNAQAAIFWLIGLGLIGALFIVPGTLHDTWEASSIGKAARQRYFTTGIVFGIGFLLSSGLLGSYGPRWCKLESESGRKLCDAAGAGGLMALALLMLVGLYTTRTRGAWVGTAAAIFGMFALLPFLFSDNKALFKTVRNVSYGSMGAVAVAFFLFILVIAPNHLVSRTVKSIPYAFMPEKTVYGQGQGTRPYLWGESPRVLVNHSATLARQAEDRSVYFAKVPEKIQAPDAEKSDWLPVGLRQILVWPFGIGIETYRYAFMSHKSKKLEALDPMTNHDNPHNNYLYLLASCGLVGLFAYLWMLWRLLSSAWKKFRDESETRSTRAIAFGVVLSFFSYSVYSIAGFDSVACSVFLYFILGTAATFFEPADFESREPIFHHLRRQIASWREKEVPRMGPAGPGYIAMALIIAIPFYLSISSIHRLHDAERAFVGPARSLQDKINNVKAAIKINPEESYYRQNLGSTYRQAANQYRQAAVKAQREGDTKKSVRLRKVAADYLEEAEKNLYAALNHAWAPENIFISLFQLYYGSNRSDDAIDALERGLSHSPHLGPVRANLAVLKLNHKKDYDAALKDALWVLDVRGNNLNALRTAARCYHKKGDFTNAEKYFKRAASYDKRNDRVLARFKADFERDKALDTSTSSGQ